MVPELFGPLKCAIPPSLPLMWLVWMVSLPRVTVLEPHCA